MFDLARCRFSDHFKDVALNPDNTVRLATEVKRFRWVFLEGFSSLSKPGSKATNDVTCNH